MPDGSRAIHADAHEICLKSGLPVARAVVTADTLP